MSGRITCRDRLQRVKWLEEKTQQAPVGVVSGWSWPRGCESYRIDRREVRTGPVVGGLGAWLKGTDTECGRSREGP